MKYSTCSVSLLDQFGKQTGSRIDGEEGSTRSFGGNEAISEDAVIQIRNIITLWASLS